MNQLMVIVQNIIKGVVVIVLVAYPFLIYFGLQYFSLKWVSLGIIGLFILRLSVLKGEIKSLLWAMRSVIVVAIFLAALSIFFQEEGWFLYYPVIVNITLLALFVTSLFHSPSMIERFARLQDPDLPPEGVKYTRKVTQIWSLFFFLNGTIAFITILLGNMKWWTLYNGAISYGLIGMLLGGEWLVRQRILQKQ